MGGGYFYKKDRGFFYGSLSQKSTKRELEDPYFLLFQIVEFNTNILETNILNLAVVIGVLVYFGKDKVNEALDTRQANIRESFASAERKFEQSKLALEAANEKLAAAQEKASDIRRESQVFIDKRSKELMVNAKSELERFETSKKQELIRQQEKIKQDLYSKLLKDAFQKARLNLRTQLQENAQLQTSVTTAKIKKFRESNFSA